MPKAIMIDDLENIKNLNGLFVNNLRQPREFKIPEEDMLWHLRLGHASFNYLKKLQKIENVKFDENSILECEVCIMAKMNILSFKQTRRRATRPLELIHSDTMGAIKPISWPGRKRYILTLIDDYSRLARISSLNII